MAGETTQTTTSSTTSASTTGDAKNTSTTTGDTSSSTSATTQTAGEKNTGSSIIGDINKTDADKSGAADKKTEGADKDKSSTTGTDLELKLPDGFDAKDPVLGDFKGLAKELGLDSPKAQKLFDLYVKQGEPLRAEIAKQQAERAQWEGQLKSDKDFGGARYDANIAAVRTLATKFEGGADFAKAIHDAGIGSHPAVVKFLARVGRSFSDDSVRGGASPKPNTEADLIASTYPNTKWNS